MNALGWFALTFTLLMLAVEITRAHRLEDELCALAGERDRLERDARESQSDWLSLFVFEDAAS